VGYLSSSFLDSIAEGLGKTMRDAQ